MAINRVGVETYHFGAKKVFGPYFGSSYVAAPDGSRTKVFFCFNNSIIGAIVQFYFSIHLVFFHFSFMFSSLQSLSTVRDGILYAELDLNLCKKMRETLGFNQSQRVSYYQNKWIQISDTSFVPQIIS